MGLKVPSLHHREGEGGVGEGDGEVQLTIEGGHPAPRHQAPVRILDQNVSAATLQSHLIIDKHCLLNNKHQ